MILSTRLNTECVHNILKGLAKAAIKTTAFYESIVFVIDLDVCMFQCRAQSTNSGATRRSVDKETSTCVVRRREVATQFGEFNMATVLDMLDLKRS